MNNNIKLLSVSVNMPVYNGAKYLRQAIDSVLSQTFGDFELIIINDGSNDKSVEIIDSYKDDRIKLFHNEKNMGLAFTRNRAVKESTGKYIAILDCDDIAYEDRIEKQVSFMETHPDNVILGSWIDIIDENGKCNEVIRLALANHLIKSQLFFGNYFAQSSMMIRRDIFKEFKYDEKFPPAEDYYLWSQIAMKYKVANLQESLVKYRNHESNISIQKKEIMIKSVKQILEFHLSNIHIYNLTKQEIDLHYDLVYNQINYSTLTQIETWKIICWINKLVNQNNKLKVYDTEYYKSILINHWKNNFNLWSSFNHGIKAIPLMWFSFNRNIKFKTKIHFILRCFKAEIKNRIWQKLV